MCDDQLSEEESDLICGVYKVSTDMASVVLNCLFFLRISLAYGDQTADMSWWPKHSTW
jgi:hypothetical protein